jgi:ADP-dependent NAD(P)H-hydrate dehydratase / NAD(P)H-hydrate epimerase
MIPICTAAQVRELDRRVIEGRGLPGRVLMEVAGRGVAEAVRERFPTASVGVWCGPGNNGGDGYVIARWLRLWGHEVHVRAAGPARTPDALANAALHPAGTGPMPRVDVIVDALLGTGQREAPRGAIAAAISSIRAARSAGASVVAVDLPTGVCADTGQALGGPGAVVEADLTLTLGRWKPGLVCAPGRVLAGEVQLIDIGLDLAQGAADVGVAGWLLEPGDVPAPPVPHAAAKWDRGHVAVRAGGGAAVLAAHGAFRGGAGLVTLLAPRDEWPALHGLWPEVILAEPATLDARRHDALVLGPGLGVHRADEVRRLHGTFPNPTVLDADALTVLAATDPTPPAGGPRVLTPHSAEAARLLGCARRDIDADRFGAVARLSRFGTPVLKGPGTLIGAPGGARVNPTGDQRLATAGSGDVLAGLIAAALATGVPPVDAACRAVFHHGAAAARMAPRGTASDLLDALRT